jgi:hypothetical protein
MIESRVEKMSYWSPFELDVIYHAEGEHVLERALHHRYKAHHSHGEWFHFEGLVEADISRLTSGETFRDIIGPEVMALSADDAERRRKRALPRLRDNVRAPLDIEAEILREIELHNILVFPRKRLNTLQEAAE